MYIKEISMTEHEPEEIRQKVREYYTAAAEERASTSSCGCCCGGSDEAEPCCGETSSLYEEEMLANLPKEVTELSLGCGDPVTLTALLPGQTVLDRGSGGGIDCFLAAERVGDEGRVIGVDMTPQMLERARKNKAKIGADNVEFRLGEIEHLPIADSSVDVVISNCVINLSTDKEQVFREIYRVLKPGGRLAVSDIVTNGELPEAIKSDLAAWAGCVAGAVDVEVYRRAIESAGLVDVEIKPVYFGSEMMREAESHIDLKDLDGIPPEKIQTAIFSARITAHK
jgi:SAM-dependent methyltransferase